MAAHARNIIILTEAAKFHQIGRIPLVSYTDIAMVYTDDGLSSGEQEEMRERMSRSPWHTAAEQKRTASRTTTEHQSRNIMC